MIRNILISTVALLAVAGAASATPIQSGRVSIKVSLSGKTESTVKADIAKAAQAACSEAPVAEYTACVRETYQDAMSQVAKLKSLRTASLAF